MSVGYWTADAVGNKAVSSLAVTQRRRDLLMLKRVTLEERICQRECANDHQRETTWSGCRANALIGTRRHARVDAEDTIGRMEQTRTWVRQVAQAMDEQFKEDQQSWRRVKRKGRWKL